MDVCIKYFRKGHFDQNRRIYVFIGMLHVSFLMLKNINFVPVHHYTLAGLHTYTGYSSVSVLHDNVLSVPYL